MPDNPSKPYPIEDIQFYSDGEVRFVAEIGTDKLKRTSFSWGFYIDLLDLEHQPQIKALFLLETDKKNAALLEVGNILASKIAGKSSSALISPPKQVKKGSILTYFEHHPPVIILRYECQIDGQVEPLILALNAHPRKAGHA